MSLTPSHDARQKLLCEFSLKQQTVIPPRASRNQPQQQKIADLPARPIVTTEPLPEQKERFHFLTWFGVGMILAVAGIAMWNLFLVPKWQAYQDQLHYGDGKISKLVADVGHGGDSTFLAFDLNGQVVIIELAGGDIAQARLYRAANLIGSNRDHKIITPEARNVKGHGKPDLIIHVEGQDALLVLYNNGSAFQWTVPK